MKMKDIENQFPNEFSLVREEPDYSENTKPGQKPSKVCLCYPSLYVNYGPEGLAKKLKELAGQSEDGFCVLIHVKPTRTSETTTLDKKTGETEENSSIDLEVQKICLPEEVEAEDDDESEVEEEDGMDSIKEAGRKLGIKGIAIELGSENDEAEKE